MLKTITINDTNVTYSLIRKSVKNINVRIKLDGIIYITANTSVSTKRIEEMLYDQSGVILKNLKNIEAMKKNSEQDRTLTSAKYLGNEYPVELLENENEKIVFSENKFTIYCRDIRDEPKKHFFLNRWYTDRCMELYEKINHEVYNDFINHNYNVPLAFVRIKEMKSRWGSCNIRDGKISMNLRLIRFPVECIYAVFYHEYTHFLHPDHSKKFHEFLNNIYPEYKNCDKILKGKINT